MGVETASDRAVFVNPDEFGANAIYTTAGGPPSDPIPGQFDRPSIEAEFNEAVTLDRRPTFFCPEGLLPDDAETGAGDRLAVDGEGAFEVVSIEPDGAGMVLLRLGALS
jgi:hypothetical protein